MAAIPSNDGASSIAMALANMTASVDIPRLRGGVVWTGKDGLAGVATPSAPDGKRREALPTPPNSISPSLPPQAFRDRPLVSPPTPPVHALGDSDVDLQDAVDHARAQDRLGRVLDLAADGLAGLDVAGAITPALLARHHLPDILLDHGPLAIRHVMAFLTASVPGFSGIPPAKARRLVVGALEGRGGPNEDVEFEKVGWGRWDAHRRGEVPRYGRAVRLQSPASGHQPSRVRSVRSPSPYASLPAGLNIPHRSRPRPRRISAGLSVARSAATLSPYLTPTPFELETDADRMSLDRSDADDDDDDKEASSSEAPDEALLDGDSGEATDEEDWASMGAAALRQGSFPASGGGGGAGRMLAAYSYGRDHGGRGHHPYWRRRDPSNHAGSHGRATDGSAPAPAGAGTIYADEGEREAAAALLSLGSL